MRDRIVTFADRAKVNILRSVRETSSGSWVGTVCPLHAPQTALRVYKKKRVSLAATKCSGQQRHSKAGVPWKENVSRDFLHLCSVSVIQCHPEAVDLVHGVWSLLGLPIRFRRRPGPMELTVQ